MRKLRRSVARRAQQVHVDEQGVISVLAAGSLLLVLGASAMGVDTGRARLFDREMQTVVDNAASDASAVLGSRYEELCGQVFDRACLEQEATRVANESALRNENYSTFAERDNAPNFVVEFGNYATTPDGFVFVPDGGAGIPTALRVLMDGTIPYVFLPGEQHFDRNGVAVGSRRTPSGNPVLCVDRATDPADCLPSFLVPEGHISVGSAVAVVDDTILQQVNALLGPMLGINGGMGISAVGYGSLADADVDLVELIAQLCTGLGCTQVIQPLGSGGQAVVGSPDQLLDSQVTIGQFLNAAADALDSQGGLVDYSAQAATLRTIAGRADGTATFRFGDLFDVQQGAGSALSGSVNVQDLLVGAAHVANGTNTVQTVQDITLPSVGSAAAVPARITTSVAIIEAPQHYIGRPQEYVTDGSLAQARTAQVAVQTTVSLLDGLVTVPIYLEGAGATADLDVVQCTLPFSGSDVQVPARTRAVYAALGSPVAFGTPGTDVDGGVSIDVSTDLVVTTITITDPSGGVTVERSTAPLTGALPVDTTVVEELVAPVLGPLGEILVPALNQTITTTHEIAPVGVELQLASETVIGGTADERLAFLGGATWGEANARTIGAPGLPISSSLLANPVASIVTTDPLTGAPIEQSIGTAEVDAQFATLSQSIPGFPASFSALLEQIDQQVVQPAFAALGVSLGQARVTNYHPTCDAGVLIATPPPLGSFLEIDPITQ